MALKITILFDNYLSREAQVQGLKAMWGFAAFVEFDDYRILFDTGSNGRVLKRNAQLLGVDLSSAQMLFLSHSHWDHIGGWDTVVEENPGIHIIAPESLLSHLIEDMKKMTSVTVVGSSPSHFNIHLHSTGVIQPEGEHSLILNTDKGLVILAGCSHPGIENIISRALELFPEKHILYVIGGFHLFRHSAEQIMQALDMFDTQFITPTHCTGQLATDIIRSRYGSRFIDGGVGKVVKF